MKCPKCNSECWRDEHPDGYTYGVWNCSECDWYEGVLKPEEFLTGLGFIDGIPK